MWLIHAIYWCRRFYGYFHGFILSVLFNSRSDWWQTIHSTQREWDRKREREREERIPSSQFSIIIMIGDGELLNEHVFEFSQFYDGNAIFCNFPINHNLFERGSERRGIKIKVTCTKITIIQFYVLFSVHNYCNYWSIVFPKRTWIRFFFWTFSPYRYFYHLIYFGACRMFDRTNYRSNLSLH